MSRRSVVLPAVAALVAIAILLSLPATVPQVCAAAPAVAKAPQNLFANPSFEAGRDAWQFSTAGGTVAKYTIDNLEAAAGVASALVTIDAVADWGVQFGQSIEAGARGKTYTFAAVARVVKDPVAVRLEIERRGAPYDRAAASDKVTLAAGAWTELHVTFKVDKDFREGWFAYISCAQANSQFRVDAFRLYEGEYVPYQKAAREDAAAGGAAAVAVFDTAAPSDKPLTGEAVAARTGWTAVPEGNAAYVFKGDAVLQNDRLAVVLRRGARGAEVYSLGTKGLWTQRATLAPVAQASVPAAPAPTPAAKDAGDVRLDAVAVASIDPSAAAVDAEFRTADGGKVRLRYGLALGQAFVRTDSLKSAAALRVEAPCRFLILPDFFADDIVIDAADIPVAAADLPSENFLLQLVGDGDAVVMTVSTFRDEDVRVGLSGQGAGRRIDKSVIRYGPDGKTWVAVLEAPGIWHRRDVTRADTGNVVGLDWKAPFPAHWRMDWRKSDRLVDSWEVVAQRQGGDYEKPGLFGEPSTIPADRSRWTTVLGTFKYPCWIDRQGQGWMQPLKSGVVRFEGPAILYPVNRVRSTPLDVFTMADIARATLGVGPCEYILDVEGQGQSYKGRATCATRDALRAIYEAKQQKARRAEIERILQDVMVFVRHIRGRIDGYVDFGHKTLIYVNEQKNADPALAEFAGQMEPLLRAIDGYYEKRRTEIRTPEYVQGLTDKFRSTLLDYEGPDALDKCKEITAAIVEVGGNQDELAGECRMAVKIIRQRAGLAMATDPRAAKVAEEIRARTQQVLRNAAGHEGARH